MTALFAIHEVEDGELWARAWLKKAGSRHEMFANIGVTARTFRDPQNPNLAGLILDVPDMAKFQALMQSDEAKKAMAEDRLKLDTFHMLHEFTP
jgi:glucan phosphorylase